MAERGGGVQFHHVTSAMRTFPTQVVDVVNAFQQRHTTEKLVAAARDARPRVPNFLRLNDRLGLTDSPPDHELQSLLNDGAFPFADLATFRAGLANREAQVCRIEVGAGPDGYGTGVLVGPDLVLTSHHVVARALSGDRLTGHVTCRFDYRVGEDGVVHDGRAFDVAARVCGSGERNGSPAGADGGLDYALLRLVDAAAETSAITGGPRRGTAPLRPSPPAALAESAVIVQHPDARPLKIAFGNVTALAGDELTHTANTVTGSSGAPLMDNRLRVTALHRAGTGPDTPQSNCAVQIAAIVAHARTAGAAL